MKTVLCIESSPRKSRSASIEVSGALLRALKLAIPDLRVDRLDVWTHHLPEFDGAMLESKYAGLEGAIRTPEQTEAWGYINSLGDRFKVADLLVFSVPMWNWSIPYKLKHLIDVVSHKDVLFTFDENGLRGVLKNKRAVCIYARGVDVSEKGDFPAAQWDFQKPYLEAWLRSIGIMCIDSLVVAKTLTGPEIDRESRASGQVQAEALAATLANWISCARELLVTSGPPGA